MGDNVGRGATKPALKTLRRRDIACSASGVTTYLAIPTVWLLSSTMRCTSATPTLPSPIKREGEEEPTHAPPELCRAAGGRDRARQGLLRGGVRVDAHRLRADLCGDPHR